MNITDHIIDTYQKKSKNKCDYNININDKINKIKYKNKLNDERYQQLANEINNINQIIEYDHENIKKNIKKINHIRCSKLNYNAGNSNTKLFEYNEK